MKISTAENKFAKVSPEHFAYLEKMASARGVSTDQCLADLLTFAITSIAKAAKQKEAEKQNHCVQPSNQDLSDVSQISMKGFLLTSEQQHAITLAIRGLNVKINAFAGTGKTTLLIEIALRMPEKKILYLAFNRKNADDAQTSFPGNVLCATPHQMAFRAVGHKFKDRLKNRIDGFDLCRKLAITPFPGLTKSFSGEMILEIIKQFCYSADSVISEKHIPKEFGKLFASKEEADFLAGGMVAYAQQAWNLLTDTSCDLPVTHDIYFKLWGLSNPVLDFDAVFFDESQDASAVMTNIVLRQKAQIIMVGDRYQSIYSWRGAVNAMDTIELDNDCFVSQSFRYGQKVADVASNILNRCLKANVKIKGNQDINSRLTNSPCRTILCRTNLKAIETAMTLYKSSPNVRIHIVGRNAKNMNDELLNLLSGAEDLINGNRTFVPELRQFSSWKELSNYAQSDEGRHLSGLVQMATMYRISHLRDILQRIGQISEAEADIVISTVHRSKGKEWPDVKIENDFPIPGTKEFSNEEAHLLYVAVTRASHNLNVSGCNALRALF